MSTQQERKRAYALAIICLVIGLISYSAFSAPTPQEPVRLMFKGTAGKVLFDHKTHSGATGYAISCEDCHHTLPEDGEALACIECHEPESQDEDIPKRSDAFHQQCIGCHQAAEAGPVECAACHAMKS